MECTDSNVSIDKTSKNKVSAVGAEKSFKINQKIFVKSTRHSLFRCIMSLSYRVTFLCNVLEQTHYTSESPVRYFFYEKVVKWCKD